MLFKVWKKAKELCRKEAQLKKDLRRIKKASLDYDALQNIVNYVANAPFGVVITIESDDGFRMKVEQTSHNSGVPYESFYDKYNKQHNA